MEIGGKNGEICIEDPVSSVDFEKREVAVGSGLESDNKKDTNVPVNQLAKGNTEVSQIKCVHRGMTCAMKLTICANPLSVSSAVRSVSWSTKMACYYTRAAVRRRVNLLELTQERDGA